jgi:hypothetical protein
MKIIITERQEDLLMEDLPISFRRRFNYNMIKDHLDFSILHSINLCDDYSTPADFIGDVCQLMVDDFLDDYYQDTNQTVDSEIKDELYHFMVHNFGYYLRNFYKQQCA